MSKGAVRITITIASVSGAAQCTGFGIPPRLCGDPRGVRAAVQEFSQDSQTPDLKYRREMPHKKMQKE